MPNYSYATLQNALDALAARLYDPTYQFWTATELTYYINESLRTWNAQAQFWRATMSFPLAANTWWYDLTAQTGSLIPYAGMQNDLIVTIEDHLLEPPTTTYPLTWTGSSQYSINDILTAIDKRQDDALGQTSGTLARFLVTAPLGGTITLPDAVIDIIRVAWLPSATYANRPLRQSGAWANRAFSHGYTTAAAAPPEMWAQSTEPPPSFDVNTVPPVTGQYEIIAAITDPSPWSSTANAVIRNPTDWIWVLKWGALLDLISREYGAKDSLRAQYCAARYREGVAIQRETPSLLAAWINNIPMAVDAVRNGDDFNSLWQNAAPGPPQSIYLAGNLMGVYPQPDAGAYTVTATVVQNAPLPVSTSDYIQVGRDDYDTIIDYAQHLAMFKAGGAEFAATVPLYQKFQQKAALYNGKLKEMGFFEIAQEDLSNLEEMRRPRFQKGTEPKAS